MIKMIIKIKKVTADVYNADINKIGKKTFYSYDNSEYINDWIKLFRGKKEGKNIGKFPFKGNDFQNQNLIAIVHYKMDYNIEAGQFLIDVNNLIPASVYFAVRLVICVLHLKYWQKKSSPKYMNTGFYWNNIMGTSKNSLFFPVPLQFFGKVCTICANKLLPLRHF